MKPATTTTTSEITGMLYFLVNPSMPNLVKIGRTANPIELRVRQLSATGVPQPFQAAAIFYVSDPETCEKLVHASLSDYRLTKNREFFEGSVAELIEACLPYIARYLHPGPISIKKEKPEPSLDHDDIYFMTFLLHDGYENGKAIATEELVEHHHKYSPLELEYKLLNLAKLGMAERMENKRKIGLGLWKLTPYGLEFLFDNKMVCETLLRESRPIYNTPEDNNQQ